MAGLAALAALVLLAGGGSAGRAIRAGTPATRGVGPGGASAGPGDRSVLGTGELPDRSPLAPPPKGGRLELQQSMHHWLGVAGAQSGAVVYDLTAHRMLFTSDATRNRPPASVEKLYTTVALLQELGPDARLRTEVLGAGRLAAHGVWRGDLYLKGGGDPTFGSVSFNQIWSRGLGSTVEDLVAELVHQRGIRRVTGRVIADASLFDALRGGPGTHFRPDVGDLGGELSALTYNHGASTPLAPEGIAAQALALGLRQARVAAEAAPAAGVTPRSATVLATVASPPMSTLVRLMDVPSDDLYAEMLTKQLGARFERAGTTAAGARVIARSVAAFGVHPRIVDGSGLSRGDQSSPDDVVLLLRRIWGTPTGETLKAALPVVGRTGTVRNIGAGTAAAGRCVAKTGTLDYVTNLAGYCESAGGHRVAFAIFIDGQSDARGYVLLGRTVGDIARLDPSRP